MADEFRSSICGESLWNSWKTMFGSSSLCLSGSIGIEGFAWPNDLFDMNISQINETSESDYPSMLQNWNPENYAIVTQDCKVALDTTSNYSSDYTTTMNSSTNWQQILSDSNPWPQKSSLFDNQLINIPSNTTNNLTNLNNFLPTFPKLSPMLKASLPKPQSPNTQPKYKELARKPNKEPALKRPRIETPSPLPSFKVRKEKMGDRITALQQLVSPFGKNDTASVLHDAVEYIKFLHDQVIVLSTSYLENKYQEGPIQDLTSRGLCLAPISTTFSVIAADTTENFLAPTFEVRLSAQNREALQL